MPGIENMSPESMARIMEIGIAKGLFKEGATIGMTGATELMDKIMAELEDANDGSQIAAMHAVIVAVAAFLMNTGPSIKAGEIVAASAIKCAENLVTNMSSDDDDKSEEDNDEDKESNNPFEW